MKKAGIEDKKDQLHILAKKLYTITLVMYLFYMFFRLAGWNDDYINGSFFPAFIEILGCCRYFFVLLVLEKILRSRKQGLVTAILLAVSWLLSRVSNVHNNLFDFMAFLLLSDLGEKRALLRWNLAARLSMIVLLAALLVLDRVRIRFLNWFLLGFANMNSTAAFVLVLLVLIWQMGMKKSKLLTFFVFWAFVYPIHFYEDCETVAALMFVFPLIQVAVEGLAHGKYSFVLKATIAIPFVFMIISVGVVLWLASFETVPYWTVWPWKAFSERFGDAANQFKLHGVSLLGTTEMWTLGYTTDNLFLNTLLCHGVIALIMVTGTFSWLFYRFYQKKQYDLMIVTVLFMLYSIMESIAISVFFNFVPLMVFADEISGRREGKERTAFQKNRMKWITSAALLLCTIIGCLLIYPAKEAGRMTPLINGEPNIKVSAPLKEEEVQTQTFEAAESFCGVRLYIATYHKYPILELTATLQNETGDIVVSKTIKKLATDNTYQTILFDDTIDAGRYSLSVKGKTKLGSAAIWETAGNLYPEGSVMESGTETDRDWMMQLIHDTVFRETGRIWICAVYIVFLIMIWMAPGKEKQNRAGCDLA